MKKIAIILLIIFGVVLLWRTYSKPAASTGAPPYAVEDLNPPDLDKFAWISSWVRPEGPPKVALQAGHWKNEQLPEELSRLKGSTGATGGGKTEAEVNLAIAEETQALLEERGIEVEILPATVPAGYWADVFVSIHADGNENKGKSGYKAAAPRRDFSGGAEKLVNAIETSYEEATGLVRDPNVTRNMRGYYAFAWWRYDHAIHPRTASAILETGFLTNPVDRRLIVNQPGVVAEGLANGIIMYLTEQNLIDQI